MSEKKYEIWEKLKVTVKKRLISIWDKGVEGMTNVTIRQIHSTIKETVTVQGRDTEKTEKGNSLVKTF